MHNDGQVWKSWKTQLVAGLEQAEQLTCNDLAQKGMQHEEAAVQHLYGRV